MKESISNKRKIILASASPRRKKLLKQIIGNDFEVIPSNYDESKTSKELGPVKYAMKNAKEKGLDIAKNYDNAIIISADTFVVKNNKFLEKPKDEDDAKKMLTDLSDSEFQVVGGLFVIDTKTNQSYNEYDITNLKFKKLTEKQIDDYIATGEPMDKAGSFGAQEKGGAFIEKIDGCYYNIPGLPISRLHRILDELHVNIFEY